MEAPVVRIRNRIGLVLVAAGYLSTALLLATPAVASEVKGGAMLAPSLPVQPQAADRTLGSAIMFAVVEHNAVLTNSVGVTSATKNAAGSYTLTFERSIRGCVTMTANTMGLPGSVVVDPGIITAAPDVSDEKVLQIRTYSHTGAQTDRYYQVQVTCLK
jgi:hypothetical protein